METRTKTRTDYKRCSNCKCYRHVDDFKGKRIYKTCSKCRKPKVKPWESFECRSKDGIIFHIYTPLYEVHI